MSDHAIADGGEPIAATALAAGLAERSRARPAPLGGRVVAVDGWSGSGKTSLAALLAPLLDAPCVHLDDLVPGWYGLDRSVDLVAEWVLRPIAEGRPASWRGWDWRHDEFGPWHPVPASDLLVVEGCGAGAARLRPWLHALVWLDTDAGERDRRLRARDDWPLYEPWLEIWAAQEAALRAGDDVRDVADVVVAIGGDGTGDLRAQWA